MGKQSSRMLYKGKDHKDIYFQGKYHDAMYLGYELLWHKIRQEGYYVLIYMRRDHYARDKIIVSIFDEEAETFEKILEVEKDPLSDAYYVDFIAAMDDQRIYLSTLGTSTFIASSTDGIHYGNTNLNYQENKNMLVFSYNYFSEIEKDENGASKRINYTWSNTSYGAHNTYYLFKNAIKLKNKEYIVETKGVETNLPYKYVTYDKRFEHSYMMFSSHKQSRFALHVSRFVQGYGTGNENETVTIKYYDVWNESSGEIEKIQGENLGINVSLFDCINGVYIFCVEKGYAKNRELHIYYSFDGIKYNNSLLIRKSIGAGIEMPAPMFVLYRMSMYYIYCTAEDSKIGSPKTLFLTTDFKHFSKKSIPSEIEIDGKTINTFYPVEIENDNVYGSAHCRYFCNGDIGYPKDGILASFKEGTVYIDNMFLRESQGNKILALP